MNKLVLFLIISIASVYADDEEITNALSVAGEDLNLSTENDLTYFLQISADLNSWDYEGEYCIGDGSMHESAIVIDPAVKFYRYVGYPTNLANPHDTDGDGISNSDELGSGADPVDSVDPVVITDPLDTGAPTTDPESEGEPTDEDSGQDVDESTDSNIEDDTDLNDEPGSEDPTDPTAPNTPGDPTIPFDHTNPAHPDYDPEGFDFDMPAPDTTVLSPEEIDWSGLDGRDDWDFSWL